MYSMGVPFMQQITVAKYLFKQKLMGKKKYPLVLMLEPLFKCNLACAGCGKIAYPDHILDRRMSVADALKAVDECGAPIISIPGGEPLLHKELPTIIDGIIDRKKYVYLCTNALLLKKRIDEYVPSSYFTWSIHLDGLKKRHDNSVCQEGVFERAVDAIAYAIRKGFRVTVNCTIFQGETAEEIAKFLDFCTELGVEGVTISPGYEYTDAPKNNIFLYPDEITSLFKDLFNIKIKNKKKWPLNHSSLYLDFLAGNQQYQCTPWGNPTYNIFGWQRPCYLMSENGYASTFKELIEDTDWSKYGRGNHSKCNNCMAHVGFEPTAVNDMLSNPLKAGWVKIRGPGR